MDTMRDIRSSALCLLLGRYPKKYNAYYIVNWCLQKEYLAGLRNSGKLDRD